MAPISMTCHRAGCPWETEEVAEAIAAIRLKDHLKTAHPDPVAPAPLKAEKLPKPKLAGEVQQDEWNTIIREWTTYKETANMHAAHINMFLLAYCEENLKKAIQRAHPTIDTKSEDEVRAAIKHHAVVPVASCTLVTIINFE